MRYIFILCLLSVFGCKPTQLSPNQAVQKLGPNPYFIINDKPVDKSEIMKYNPTDIAIVVTYYGKDATKKFGDKAKDGAVAISTKSFARDKYETFFKSYSKDYAKVMNEINTNDIQYILNDRILTSNFEGDLALVNNKLIKELKILDQKTLVDKYQITDKKVGVKIECKRPKSLYNSKKKF
ncbi:MAG: hypothetical protein JSS79_19125 [Bacteroidetes bacterium]|nr:hypothetical protein [Bacteroidota bacterium]